MDRSDTNARLLLDLAAKISPEDASQTGIESADRNILDLTPGFEARNRAARRAVQAELEARTAAETDALVREDLAILLHSIDLDQRADDAERRSILPMHHVARRMFWGVKSLLDDQVATARRPAALVRLQRYTGLTPGTTPMTELARADTLAALRTPGLSMHLRSEIEKTIATTETSRDGIVQLFETYGLASTKEAQKALGLMKTQLAEYARFLREKVLPLGRTTAPLPPAIYALKLEQLGVDLPPGEVAAMGHKEFVALQQEMQPLAADVARARNLPSTATCDVVRALKKEQLGGDVSMAHYRQRNADIEAILREHDLVTLPDRPPRMRLGTEAENAVNPSPSLNLPRLVGNQGEVGEFVLPLNMPAATGAAAGSAPQVFDDFTYAAASWTLSAHEVRPGHELQLDAMVERGVPLARAIFAFNSTNIEGWGLYAESMILPYMPPEGKLVSLLFRLHRAARAFLDPEVQTGKQTFASARDFLQKEVCMSPAFANSEAERYTFDDPGQATSYFYGFVRLRGLRHEAEEKLGDRFSARAFHDAIIDQGFLPPDLMRVAVLDALGVPVK